MKVVFAGLIVVFGVLIGAGVGFVLRPQAADGEVPPTSVSSAAGAAEAPEPSDYVDLGRQIVIPVVDGGTTKALVLLDLALAVAPRYREEVFAAEPRLRDAFLRVLFEFSYTGAFLETYTGDRIVGELRARLLDAAQAQLPGKIEDVLVLDLLRREL